jgi:hypothetical protein
VDVRHDSARVPGVGGDLVTGWPDSLRMRTISTWPGERTPARGRDLIRQHGGIKAALMATHPDHGGDPQDFADVQVAREEGADA